MKRWNGLLVLGMICAAVTVLPAEESEDTTVVGPWKKLAHGVWSVGIGDLEHEHRYTQFAAAPPKFDRLNQKVDVPRPSVAENIVCRVSADHHQVMVRIPTDVDEKIYGYGLQFDGTQKNRRILTLKVDHFSQGGGATHAPVPFFISSKGYGIFFNVAKFLKVYNQVGNRKGAARNPPEVDRNPPADEPQAGPWLAQPPSDAVEAYIHGRGLELVMFAGTDLLDVVSRYNLYCGGGAMPPLWGLGFWHRVPSKFSADETLRELSGFEKHQIPLDVIGLEPGWQTKSYPCTFEWQKKRFPDPAGFVQELLDRGIRLNLWENPYISQHARIYPDMLPLSGSHLVWLGIVPDYMLPETRQILLDQHKTDHFDIGISGYKIDEVDGYDVWLWPDHATFPSGTSAEVMRQTYGLQMQNMLYQQLYRQHNKRTYGLVRASNGGASGYPFVIYSDSYGHQQYITGLSSASLCGILWCPEIRSARNEREWINRMHTTCLSPLAMLNAWSSGTKPWSYPDATDAIRETIELRMQLLPYLYTAFADYHLNGIPPVRSMLLETGRPHLESNSVSPATGEDPYADGQAPQQKEDNSLFMFGPSILVAPFKNQEIERTVKLPPGNWYDFHSGKWVGNQQEISISANETGDLPPMFVKEGSLIPMLEKPVQRTRDAVGARLEIRHYGQAEATYALYEDDGETFAYESGMYRRRRFQAKKNAQGEFELVESIEKHNLEHDSVLFGEAGFRAMTPAKR